MLTATDMTQLKDAFVTRVEHEDAFSFIVENMATKEDIRDIRAEMATKEDIADIRAEMATKDDIREIWENMATKEDIRDLNGKFDQMMGTLDGIAGAVQDMRLENSVSAAQYTRQVEWNHRVAEKIDVPFEY